MTALNPPTIDDAARIASDVFGRAIANTKRLNTGSDNWVFAVGTIDGERAVVRIMREHHTCPGAVRWNEILRPMGVPLPRLIAHHVGDGYQRSWMVLERLPGRDLGHVYNLLTDAQKMAILKHVLRAQQIVHTLPRPDRFGYVGSPDDSPPHAKWAEVLHADLDRSRAHIETVGVVNPRQVHRARRFVDSAEYHGVEPVAFLDDTTTRNVMVADGEFTGIVDVDGICYGDPMLAAALTRMALLYHCTDTRYAEAWFNQLDPDHRCRRRFDAYTAMFCVNFLSELGQQFNREAPVPVDRLEVQRLEMILDNLLGSYE